MERERERGRFHWQPIDVRIGHARRHVCEGGEGDKAERKPNTNRKHHRIHLTVATIYHNSMHAMSCQSSGHPKGVNCGTHISPTLRLATECGGREERVVASARHFYKWLMNYSLYLFSGPALLLCAVCSQIRLAPGRRGTWKGQ